MHLRDRKLKTPDLCSLIVERYSTLAYYYFGSLENKLVHISSYKIENNNLEWMLFLYEWNGPENSSGPLYVLYDSIEI